MNPGAARRPPRSGSTKQKPKQISVERSSFRPWSLLLAVAPQSYHRGCRRRAHRAGRTGAAPARRRRARHGCAGARGELRDVRNLGQPAHLMREAIKCHQRSSEDGIDGDGLLAHLMREAIRGHQRSSDCGCSHTFRLKAARRRPRSSHSRLPTSMGADVVTPSDRAAAAVEPTCKTADVNARSR